MRTWLTGCSNGPIAVVARAPLTGVVCSGRDDILLVPSCSRAVAFLPEIFSRKHTPAGQRLYRSLVRPYYFHKSSQAGLLPIRQDAQAVQARGKPGAGENGAEQQRDRHNDLPPGD